MKRNEKYDALSASAYYEEVVSGNSEALYYLLKRKLEKALMAVYGLHGFGLSDDFEDTLDDFFLYLYDGNKPMVSPPFSLVRGIQDKRAFFGWMVATYRHFLLNRVKEELKRKELLERVRVSSKGEDSGIPNETMILFLASAIAYYDQQFAPRNRFVFYRMLLSFLDHSKAVPQEAMARALDMRPVTYRVSTKRQKDRFLEYIIAQEAGLTFDLDSYHSVMRDRIVDAFEKLYELLMEFYDRTLADIPNAKAIQSLRLRYDKGDGMMHEGELSYGFVNNLDVKLLYPKIKCYLAESG